MKLSPVTFPTDLFELTQNHIFLCCFYMLKFKIRVNHPTKNHLSPFLSLCWWSRELFQVENTNEILAVFAALSGKPDCFVRNWKSAPSRSLLICYRKQYHVSEAKVCSVYVNIPFGFFRGVSDSLKKKQLSKWKRGVVEPFTWISDRFCINAQLNLWK